MNVLVPSTTTLGFTGHESDDELGLVNMKGRIYDPKVGRFLTTDPIVSAPLSGQSFNAYSYVFNNPLSYVDPSGFEPDTVPFARVEPIYGPNGEPIGLTGMLGGLALGLVPFASVGEQILDAADVLPQTQHFRVGVAIGQIFGGLASILGGATGEVAGGVLTTTGIGAALGVPAIAVSTTLIIGGIGNIAAGVHGLMTTGSGSNGAAEGRTPQGRKGFKSGRDAQEQVEGIEKAQQQNREQGQPNRID